MIGPYVMHVPTSTAVKHPGLVGVNSDTNFIKYLAWFESCQGSRLELSSESLALFPSMLPYPEALLPAGTEVGTEEVITWWTKAFLNAFIAWGNFVTLGCPTSGSSAYEPRVGHRSMESIRVFTDELLGEMREFVCLDLVLGRLGCEGKRATVEQLLAQVSCTVGACYMSEPVGGSLPSTALPVTASRVAIPEVAGTVDPLQWLEPERADIVANLDRLRLPEPLWEDIVVACHRVPEEDEPALARKLLETGMAVLIPEQDLPRDSDGRLLAGGLFCVGKNAQEDRLIYDRRPENGTMPRLRWAELPSGACFTRMLLRPDQYLRGSGDDLRNYYYSLKLPENWIRFNSVGRRVCAEVLREQGRDPQVPHRLCFRVLGMGDRNGCCIAQATHEAVLKKHGVLQEAEKLVYGRHVPVGDRWEGVYLDDLLITQKVTMPYDIPLDGTFVPPAAQADDDDMVQVARAEQAYVKAKLQRAVHKAFRAETSFRAWGAEVDGIKGCVGAPKEMRKQLWVLIEMIVAGGYVCQDVLRKIVGYLAFCFQYRRELYALLHHMYKYIDRMPQSRWVRIPGHIADELRSCALHLPFACCSMRRQLSGTIVATDATPTGGGAVFANVPSGLASELWRRSEIRGQAVRLDRESDLRLDAEVPAEPSKFASVVSQCVHWHVRASYSFRQTSHINLQEARALRRELMRMAANPAWRNHLIICLNDSRVVVGCMSKGRSSSYKLNGVMRSLVPHLVTSGLGIGLIWIETGANIADCPSRFTSLPPPCRSPRWLRQFGVAERGQTAGMEVFTRNGGITSACMLAGFRMLPAVDLRCGHDVWAGDIDDLFSGARVDWVWFVLPRGSFLPRRCAPRGVRLRTKEAPEGEEARREIAEGNALWRRTLWLASLALGRGCQVVLEHPAESWAWRMPETQMFAQKWGLHFRSLDLGMFHGSVEEDGSDRRCVRILSNASWLELLERREADDRKDGASRTVTREARGVAHPRGFCEEVANALGQWQEGSASEGRGADC